MIPGSVGSPLLPCLSSELIPCEAIVKSGLTTISIIIVSISLYPVHDLLSSLKVSHFFICSSYQRVIRAKNSFGYLARVPEEFPLLQSTPFPTHHVELSSLPCLSYTIIVLDTSSLPSSQQVLHGLQRRLHLPLVRRITLHSWHRIDDLPK